MARFSYSRWDGTQVGFDMGADEAFAEINDELLTHGDLNQALQRLLQRGFSDRNGERVQGMRELLERLRQRRREMLEQNDLGGVYEDVAQRLREVLDMERAGIDDLAQRARESGISVGRRSRNRRRRSAGWRSICSRRTWRARSRRSKSTTGPPRKHRPSSRS